MNFNFKKKILLAFSVITGCFSLHYITGPAGNGFNVTGAPFDNGTCNNCHYGGSYNSTVSLQLLSGGLPVTNYTPGAPYILRISRAAIGLPPGGGFGFQLTCAAFPGNIDINTWGTSFPLNAIKRSVNGRHYIEHTEKIGQSNAYIDIPWTGPALAGTATVKFYLALNTVDGDVAPTPAADEVLTTTLTINVSPLSINGLLYFYGFEENDNSIQLKWATENKTIESFEIEKSEDGIRFSSFSYIQSESVTNHAYHYTDRNPFQLTFYRIKQTDRNKETGYSPVIQVKTKKQASGLHYVKGNEIIILIQNKNSVTVTAALYTSDGKPVYFQNLLLKEGDNEFIFPKPFLQGLYFISIRNEKEILYSGKVLVD